MKEEIDELRREIEMYLEIFRRGSGREWSTVFRIERSEEKRKQREKEREQRREDQRVKREEDKRKREDARRKKREGKI